MKSTILEQCLEFPTSICRQCANRVVHAQVRVEDDAQQFEIRTIRSRPKDQKFFVGWVEDCLVGVAPSMHFVVAQFHVGEMFVVRNKIVEEDIAVAQGFPDIAQTNDQPTFFSDGKANN